MNRVHFYLPTEVFEGEGSVLRHTEALVLGRKALIVTGKHGAEVSGALADVQQALEARRVAWAHFNGVGENPDDAQVYAGAAVAQAEGCDFVVAVGGGSAMDAAKAIAWVVGGRIDREDFFAEKPQPGDEVLPIAAVPITCGTGSEVTPYAIITNHHARTKVNVSGPQFFPRVALLDGRYLASLPDQVVCDTALDALSHAIEGAYSLRSDALSLSLALEAIGVVMPELVRLAHGVFVNRSRLLYGSMVAGMVIAQAGTGLVHAMGYPLTYYKQLPHGRANGVLLAGYLEFMEHSCPERTAQLMQALGIQAPEEFQALVDMLLDRLGCAREVPSEEELVRFTREPLRLEVVRRYRTMPSPEEVMDIYRYGF